MTRKPIMETIKARYTDRPNEELCVTMQRGGNIEKDGYRIFEFGWTNTGNASHQHYWGKVMANGDVLISLGRMNFEKIGNVAKK